MTLVASDYRLVKSNAGVMGDQIDHDIARIRAEIENLKKQRKNLSASLLSSTAVQNQIRSRNNATWTDRQQTDIILPDSNPLVEAQAQHNETNVHRLAFGVTSFPFTDPNPGMSEEPLLGIRFDIPDHTGRFDRAPYYLFCKRMLDTTSSTSTNTDARLTIHHHTIPAFVPLQRYIDKYLVVSDPYGQKESGSDVEMEEGDPQSSSSPPPPPSPFPESRAEAMVNPESNTNSEYGLHALTHAIYMDLKSHSIRRASIQLLQSSLRLPSLPSFSGKAVFVPVSTDPGLYSLRSLEATEDCRFLRLIWSHGMVGRIFVSEEGIIDKVVVISEKERRNDIERTLAQDALGNRVRIVDLKDRFAEVERLKVYRPKNVLVNADTATDTATDSIVEQT